MYDAHHEILPLREPAPGAPHATYDVVGPVCETGDIFARNRDLPPAKPDDLMVIMTAGAYGAAMASAYNSRPPAPEVLVRGRDYCVVNPRLTHEAMIARERIPDWLA